MHHTIIKETMLH